MKRKIIKIDESKCDGCGMCIPDCPEGALQVIDGKVRLISDLFCDGLGACLGACPTGAITVEEREAEPYDEKLVMANIIKQGPNVITAHLKHLRDHNETEFLKQAEQVLKEHGLTVESREEDRACHANHHHVGCPGSAVLDMRSRAATDPVNTQQAEIRSELRSWPVQLKLLHPSAPYLKKADLLVSADCVPFSYADFHRRFLKGKIMLTFCPKLDPYVEEYIDKLTMIFKENEIKSVTVLHMEVPCCSGTLLLVRKALDKAAKSIPVIEHMISISGEIL